MEAGPDLCPIYENSTELVRARIGKLIDRVHLEPASFYNDSDPTQITFGIVDYTAVTIDLLGMLYDPYDDAPTFAQGVAQLEQGNASLAYDGPSLENTLTAESCSVDPSQPFVANSLDTEIPISCGDALVNQLKTFQQAFVSYQDMLKVSPFGSSWYNGLGGACA